MELGDAVPSHEPQPVGDLPAPRRLKITMKILDEFGTTDNCPQCVHVRAFREAKPGLGHTEACRQRLVTAMAATDAGTARLEQHDTRTDRLISQRIEAADEEIARLRAEAQPALPAGSSDDQPPPTVESDKSCDSPLRSRISQTHGGTCDGQQQDKSR